MSEADFQNRIRTINGKWDGRIKSLQKDLLACEDRMASLGTPARGGLPPVMTAAHLMEQKQLDQRIQTLVQQFNQANRDW